MKSKVLLCFAFVLSGTLFGNFTVAEDSGAPQVDQVLTDEISSILRGCEKIKPGMTRAQLLELFTTEGGLSTARHRTYVYRRCPYIKEDVDFNPSTAGQRALDERMTDRISKISKPYLQWSIAD